MTSTATVVYCTSKWTTPGPGAYSPPSDFGKAPSYTIKHRYKEKFEVNQAPYQALPTTIGTGQKHSISIRTKERDFVSSPGPNYLPPKFGSEGHSSAFHFRGKTDEPPESIGPGPGKYDTRKKFDGHKYTIKSRNFANDEKMLDGPGAGKYAPDYDKVMKRSIQTSIGHRYKERPKAVTPGPADYEINRNLENRPQSFHARTRSFNNNDTPGPGKYDISAPFGKGVPSYSFRSRINIPKKQMDPPYNKVPDYFGKEGRKQTIGVRFSKKATTDTPGPSYVPPNFGEDGTKCAIRSRRTISRDTAETIGPGSGKYNTRPPTGGYKITIKSRAHPPDEIQIDGPGVGKYAPNYDAVMKSSQKTLILNRYKEKDPEPSPGYVALPDEKGIAYTIGRKENIDVAPGNIM
ncbi:hypothetical protein GPJ56_010998 [Histomonas meleagridis]|uniref:uncharacterized protein n=1 Tax=Histomonas meleagridis TaxID=135588 RepID=UPI00355A3777|nr:hypothetical protein GPJ56_010998 [Histomonas meleagridis]KAH0800775.1 hypothetical protein GO595_006528 [Histomonas meleagridis]